VTGERLADLAGSLGLSLAPEQVQRLVAFAELLAERGPGLGLISERDVPRVTERHVIDCLRAVDAVDAEDRDAYDLGSGAGLPGIVVAVVRPDLLVTLVEPQRRRIGWLEFVGRELALPNVSVAPRRAQDLDSTADVCFARAFRPLERSWDLAEPLLREGGRLVYFGGRGFPPSRAAALSADVRILDSDLESSGPLVIIRKQ